MVSHNGTQSFPDVCSYAGVANENDIGDVGIGSVTANSFSIINKGSGGVLCTIRDGAIKPSTIMQNMQVSVNAIICEKKV